MKNKILVDKITLEYIIEYCDILAMNYTTIKHKVHEFVCKKYQEEYNYGVEYYCDYKVVNVQDNIHDNNKRVMITLLIYRDEGLKYLQKEAEDRLESGL